MKEDHEVCTVIRFRGRRVKILYEDSYDEYYGYLWRFVSREMVDAIITIGDHQSITRQIRRHAESRTGKTARKMNTIRTICNRRSKANDR